MSMWTIKDVITVALSSTAFFLSVATAWFTLWRRGRLYLPRPAQIYFGYDTSRFPGQPLSPKVYVRCTLFSSGKRGHVLESLYVRLHRGETAQVFNVWVFGDKDNLSRGSGLYVGEQGVVSHHHFLLPTDGTSFPWLEGVYTLQIFATTVPGRRSIKLFEQRLSIGSAEASALKTETAGVFFDWSPEAGTYQRHARPALPAVDDGQLP